MVELGIVGAKNSGKTTLIEQLICRFTRMGLRVGTIKHTTHSHRFDTPGKDTFRHRRAGAALTLAVSDTEAAVFMDSNEGDEQLLNLLRASCDICLVEGDKRHHRAKVLLTWNLQDKSKFSLRNVLATYGPGQPLLSQVDHYSLLQVDELTAHVIDALEISAQREVSG